MALLYLIRHARPEGAGTFLGQEDPPLAPGALDQVAQSLSTLSVKAAYLSPLRRAVQTASCLRCTRVRLFPELREIGFGQWTGKTWSEIEAQWPELAMRKLRDWEQVTPPRGELWTDFSDRVRRAWDRIREGPFPAAIVAHQGVNAILANFATGVPVWQFKQGYGEIREVSYNAA
ncbi:MAG: histidine phosphatase family protein [Bryobacteraceae bacterium]